MLTLRSIPDLRHISRKKLITIAVVALLLLIPLFFLILLGATSSSSNQAAQTQKTNFFGKNGSRSSEEAQSTDLSSTFVYGVWNSRGSSIKAVDLITNKTTVVAQLPQDIKKVSIISPTQVLYISQTDVKDHGVKIVSYNIKEKKTTVLIEADNGFGVDDYVLSPNKRYIAVWEAGFQEGSKIFYGGRSRVYAIDLTNPSIKHLLFDEVATEPIRYPQAITNTGLVFADKFLPNDPNGGAGWAYGMSIINYDGTNRRDLTNMQAGTYGTQPFLAPDGKSLVFAGYDGSRGNGTIRKNGFRQALLTPNTVEMLDTKTLKRKKLANLPNTNFYTGADWGGSNADIILTVLSKEKGMTGIFSYNLKDNSLKKINLPKSDSKSYSYVAQTPNLGLLLGTVDDSLSSVGNLGDSYIPSLTSVYFQPYGTDAAKLIALQDVLAQYISLLPANYFEEVLGSHTSADDGSLNIIPTLINFPEGQYSSGKESLQLRTFLLPKQELPTIRKNQQSNPLPTPTFSPTITPTPTQIPTSTPTPTPTRAPLPTSGSAIQSPAPTQRVIPTRRPTKTPTPTINRSGPTPTPTPRFVEDCTELAEIQCSELGVASETQEFDDCVDTNKEKNRATRGTPGAVCSKSPLYLYGPAGFSVGIKIQTAVYNDAPQYIGGYKIKLLPQGQMEINNSLYQSIKYDYTSNLRRITPPTRGTVAKRPEIEKVIKEYGQKLGLNSKETADLIMAAETKTSSPYIFISFFDQETSEHILPLSFMPIPDNYLNVVFYFKQLEKAPNHTPPPIFPKPVKRTGFTAIEVSEIIE